MSKQHSKFILLLSVVLIAFMIMPAFAEGNQTVSDVNQTDYYVNASVSDDNGTGSMDNPYKTLNSSRLVDNSIIHFANGDYEVNDYSYVNNVTFIGESSAQTIVRGLSINSNSNSILTFKNITFVDSSFYSSDAVTDNADFNSTYFNINNNFKIVDSNFKESHIYSFSDLTVTGSDFYSGSLSSNGAIFNDVVLKDSSCNSNDLLIAEDVCYDNSKLRLTGFIHNFTRCTFKNSYDAYGGAISSESCTVNLNNCTFQDNEATRGGSININGGVLNIIDSLFANNNASQWGGAIVAEKSSISVENSIFANNHALSDAGGAIYLKNSNLTAYALNITDSSATFGCAITSLVSNVTMTNFYGANNNAKYDGGAIYSYGGTFSLTDSTLKDNAARNGGALFVDAAKELKISHNVFTSNNAQNYAGAVYSIVNNYTIGTIVNNNTFSSNKAKFYSDVYESANVNVEIGNGNYTFIKIDYTDDELPSSYKSPYVTSVKNQGSGGNCWAFTAAATLEAAIKKATGVEYDLSEGNMKNIMSKYSDYGWRMETNTGGYDDMGFGYLVGWLGPINETDDPYNPNNLLSPLSEAIFHVQNVVFLQRNNQTDTKAIKEAVLKYGAVGTCIYWESSFNKNGNYYYNGDSSVNHAVTIVGWDDSYSKSNFKNNPAGNGAWLIKNSWGTSSGNKGYYYVSYYDTRIAYHTKNDATFAFILNDTMRYDRNYQYDIPGRTDYLLDDGDVIWYKNIFNSTGDEYLSAVSTYFEYAANWTVSIYVNGDLKLTQSGSSPASYSTIGLDYLIPLKYGDSFEVVFKVTNPRKVTSFPISEFVSLNYEFYRPGISYFSKDGKSWIDLYNYSHKYTSHTYASQVACIKAFTIFDELNTTVSVNVSFNSLNTVDLVAQVFDQYDNLIKGGSVVFALDNANFTVDIVDGYARLTHSFVNNGQNLVKVSFSNEGYVSSQNQTEFNLTNIVSYDVSVYYNDVVYEVILQDAFSNPLSGKTIVFTLNGSTYNVDTDVNGKASIETSLPIGEYPVSVEFMGDDYYMNSNTVNVIKTISTIKLPEQTQYTYNAKYCASLLDGDGNALANAKVTVLIGGVKYSASTDANGNFAVVLTQSPGTYQVTVTNPDTSESLNQSIKIVKRIIENKALTMYYKSGATYKVKVLDDNGNIAKGVKVTFKVNGKTYTRTSDSKGYAALTINLKPGTYTIKATYKGYTVSNKLVVKTTIITKNISVKKGKTIKFTAKLLNTKGKILKNKKITFKFKGKTYKIKTNSKGIATLKITKKYKVGKYTITSTYGGLKISNKITIKK